MLIQIYCLIEYVPYYFSTIFQLKNTKRTVFNINPLFTKTRGNIIEKKKTVH